MDAVEPGMFWHQGAAPGRCLQMENVDLLMNSFDTEFMKSKIPFFLQEDLSQTQCLALLLTVHQNCTCTTGKRARPFYEENLDLWLYSWIKIISDSGMLPFLSESSNHEGFVKPVCFMDCMKSCFQPNSFYQKVSLIIRALCSFFRCFNHPGGTETTHRVNG